MRRLSPGATGIVSDPSATQAYGTRSTAPPLPTAGAPAPPAGPLPRAAAQALGMMGDLRGLDFLIETLQSTHPGFRRMATTGLGQVGDPRAVQPLISALTHGRSYLQRRAAEALEKIADPAGLDAVRRHREAEAQTAPD